MRGIIFTKENRQNVRDGSKTQTRRIIKMPEGIAAKYEYSGNDGGNELLPKLSGHYWMNGYAMWRPKKCPYGVVGDRLYLQEPYQITTERGNGFMYGIYLDDEKVFDIKLNEDEWSKWANRKWPHHKTTARFMYKSLARIWFEITGIRVERVQDISEKDCEKEGIRGYEAHGGGTHFNPVTLYPAFPEKGGGFRTAKEAFEVLWDSINAKRGYGWDKNPWVWVIELRKVKNGE